MSDDAIRTGGHALDFATLRTHGCFGITATEVAERAVLLSPVAVIARHGLIARVLS